MHPAKLGERRTAYDVYADLQGCIAYLGPPECSQLRDMLRYQLMPPVKPVLVKVSTKTCFSSGDRIGVRGSCFAS